MRYFIGCAPTRFPTSSGQAAIHSASYSLENLKAGPNRPGQPCAGSAPPLFHTGDAVTMEVDLRAAPGHISWRVGGTDTMRTTAVDARVRVLHPHVSLYNREALFDLETAAVVSAPDACRPVITPRPRDFAKVSFLTRKTNK
mmetsp:Transcript_35476/g.82865  ORF Transcript_35476/g.82865 Transcript_35476/m.82865 type:complete len:142 (-) Transcript_35476:8-433(-)